MTYPKLKAGTFFFCTEREARALFGFTDSEILLAREKPRKYREADCSGYLGIRDGAFIYLARCIPPEA